jgi:hypothetical protein
LFGLLSDVSGQLEAHQGPADDGRGRRHLFAA